MLRNYLTIARRNLRKRLGYTLINVTGLAVGLASCLLIGLWVQDELSYDRFHENADRTYRVLREFDLPDLKGAIATTPSALAPALAANIPAVEATVRVSRQSAIVQHGTQQFVESGVVWADPSFFEVFSFPVVRGTAALDRPGTVVLTEAMTAKYFGGEDPVGQTLRIGEHALEVTGVLAEVPANSHLQFGFVASLETRDMSLGWGRNNYATYVLLQRGHTKEDVAAQVAEVVYAHREPAPSGSAFIPHLQPITGIHLGQGVPVDIGASGNVTYVYLFAALALFILLLACVNFMNLATARSVERSQEVGVRKALGAARRQLAGQFLGESTLMSLLALGVALGLCWVALPAFNALAGKEIAFGALAAGPALLAVVGLVIVVGLVAGSYPALVLSSYEPVAVLRGTSQTGEGARLRKGLVVFQFAVAVALIAGTGVVRTQLDFLQGKGLGFDEEHVVVIEQAQYLGDRVETFKQELAQQNGVAQVASGFSVPGSFFINSMWRPVGPEAEDHNVNYSFVGYDYVDALDIRMKAGRDFSRSFATDSFAVVLNETAARDFGWTPEEAIGQKITRGPGDYQFTVIGVAEDFHYESLHATIYPLALFGPLRAQRYVMARVQPDEVAEALEGIRATWQQFSDLPLEYSFLADDLAAQYEAEMRLERVFGVFAGLAIFIACLGLLGLAAFAAQKRTKEIGIRKALGASVASIVALLSADFLKLVAAAFLIATPVAYVAMQRWLEDFAYRIDLGVGAFVTAGALALGIALLTVSYQAYRAAQTDPVQALRTE